MQIPKISVALCVFGLGATLLSNAADNPEQAAARAALAAKLAELGAEMPATNAVESAPAPKLEAPVAPQISEPVPAPAKVEEPVMVPVNASAEVRARAKADKAAAALKAKKDAEIAAADAKAKKQAEKMAAAETKKFKADKNAPAISSMPAPMPAPPSTIPATKEMRLDALLQKYKTDQITPQQYQEQRAAILAEP